jgi:hypothetical protein
MMRAPSTKPRHSSASAFRLFLTLLGTALMSCGASTVEPDSAADVESGEGDDEHESYVSGDDSYGESETAAPTDPCTGGTCSPCGEVVCLEGFFCNESSQACGWVPACADTPSCECLEKALPDCSCSARDGGLYLTCE